MAEFIGAAIDRGWNPEVVGTKVHLRDNPGSWDERVNSTSLQADEGFVAVGGDCRRRESYA
jgi:hypothetical protein